MPFVTRTTWFQGAIGIPHNSIVHSEADKRKAEGKTDGFFQVETSPEGLPIVVRNWTTRQDAEDWCAYVNQYGPTTCEIEET